MAYINYTQANPLYSPGIATYSSDSEKGDTGKNGLSIYYNDGVIEYNTNEKNRVIQNILNKSLISSTESSDREIDYKTGDLIIDGNSDVYEISIDETNATDTDIAKKGTIRQTIGKIYKHSNDDNLFDEDIMKITYLDSSYHPCTQIDASYVRVINTETGEIAIFNNDNQSSQQ